MTTRPSARSDTCIRQRLTAVDPGQRGSDGVEVEAKLESHRSCGESVRHVVRAMQRQRNIDLAYGGDACETTGRAKRVEHNVGRSNVGLRAEPERHDARAGPRRHRGHGIVIGVEHRDTVVRQRFDELTLGLRYRGPAAELA